MPTSTPPPIHLKELVGSSNVKKLRHKIFKEIFILGAGFSRPAGFPLLNDVHIKLDENEFSNWGKITKESRARVQEIMRSGQFANYEQAMTQFFRDNSQGDFDTLLLGLCATLDGCASQFLADHTRIIPYLHFLKYVATSSSAILTFNYDTVLEMVHYEYRHSYSFGRRKNDSENYARLLKYSRSLGLDFGLGDGWIISPYVSGTESIEPPLDLRPFLKLHGGMNWWWCNTCRKLAYEADYTNNTHSGKCFRCNSSVRPGLIPPIDGKQIKDFESLWEHAAFLLYNCERIIIVGYSFPEGDEHARILLRKTLERNPPPRILICDFSSLDYNKKRMEIIERFNKIFSFALNPDEIFLQGVESFFL